MSKYDPYKACAKDLFAIRMIKCSVEEKKKLILDALAKHGLRHIPYKPVVAHGLQTKASEAQFLRKLEQKELDRLQPFIMKLVKRECDKLFEGLFQSMVNRIYEVQLEAWTHASAKVNRNNGDLI